MPSDEKNQLDSPNQPASGDSNRCWMPLSLVVLKDFRCAWPPRESAANIPAGLIQQRKVGQGRFTLIRELGQWAAWA